MMENAPAQKNEKLMKKVQNDDGMAIYQKGADGKAPAQKQQKRR